MSLVRPAEPHDLAEILQLLDHTFSPSNYESQLVHTLLSNQRDVLHWVVEDVWGVNGYVCFTLAYRDEAPIGWHLAPVAISPIVQGRGLGTRLIKAALNSTELEGEAVFVLGDPLFYQRFGFELVKQPTSMFDTLSNHFLARNYSSGEAFTIGYEPEFTALPQVELDQ